MARDVRANEPTAKDVREAFNAILQHEKELASEQGSYMERCREIRSSIAAVYDDAKDKGINKKVLRAKVKEHNLLKKAEKCRAELEADEQSEFDLIRQKLGGLAELPLGLAAINGRGKAGAEEGARAH